MNRILASLLVIVFLTSHAMAQVNNNLVIFSNDGDKFYLILNGERYNETPATNVRAEGLSLKYYKVKIIFEDTRKAPHDNGITFYSTNKECVFGLMKENKKKYRLDYISEKDIIPVTETPVSTNNTNTNTNNTSTYTPTNTTPTYTTPTNTNNSQNSDGISINTGQGVNIGVNSNGGLQLGTKVGGINMNASDKSGNIKLGNGPNNIVLNKAPAKTGCANAMTEIEFEGMKKNVKEKTEESEKLTAATKLLENNNCFKTSQVKEVMQLFTEDSSKLEFAKNAYTHTNDISNYGQLKDTFNEQESKEELQMFIKDMK